MKLIAIAGGIGSGKSVLCRILSTMGYLVYDTDSAARRLMNLDELLRARLTDAFGPETYHPDGTLNRSWLAAKVFGREEELIKLNSIVHPAVATHLMQWAQSAPAPVAFVETALINTGGIRPLVQGVWMVQAPVAVRCSRVMARSGLSECQVLQRIKRQAADDCPGAGDVPIVNDSCRPLLPQIIEALQTL